MAMSDDTPVGEIEQWVVEQCDRDPPERAKNPHPKLFSDFEKDRVSDALFRLWRKGLLYAEWDEEDQCTRHTLSHFGEEVCERGLLRTYVEAMESEGQIDATPPAMEVLEP